TPEQVAQVRADQPIILELAILPPEVDREGLGALLLVPARIRERLMGLMVVESDRAEDEETLTLALAIARLAALLLERDRLDREREEARSSARALAVANERLDAFLSMTGHEVLTPLTKIKGYLQVAARRLRPQTKRVAALAGRLDAERRVALAELLDHARAPLAEAERESDLMQRLVDDTLDAEAIRSGTLDMRREPCDLTAIARATVDGLRIR